MLRYPNAVLLFAAFVTFGVVFGAGEALFRNSNSVAGIATLCAASVVVAGDLLFYRRRDDPEVGLSRYWSSDSGGFFVMMPAWIVGLIAFGCGIALIVKDLK